MNRVVLRIITGLILAAGLAGIDDGVRSLEPDRSGFIDVHMHLMPVVAEENRDSKRPMKGRGSSSRGKSVPAGARDFARSADNLVKMMDELGIAKAVVLPPPQSPNQRGAYTYHEFLPAIRRHPGRLVLGAGGGVLNPLIMGTDSASVTASLGARFEKLAEEIADAGARCFGEMTTLHFSFNEGHVFEQAPADHPLFLLLADVAARRGIPIDLHWEAVPEEQPTPGEVRERSPNNPARIEATIPGLERLLAHNRKARIVLVHVGWDNTGHQTTTLLRRLLSDHPNLICGLKFVRKSYEPFGKGNKMADESLRIRKDWVELMREFPDRFVVGADEFILPGNSSRRGPPSFEDTWSIIEQLPPDLRVKIGGENAARIYGF